MDGLGAESRLGAAANPNSRMAFAQTGGVVGFSNVQTAARALNEGEVINQRMMALVMKLTHPEKDRQSRQTPALLPPSSTLYINNLNEKIPTQKLEKDLKSLFSRFGKIEDFSALKSFWRRGQAFIAFETINAASDALAAMQGRVYEGKALRINFARRQSRPRDLSEKHAAMSSSDRTSPVAVKKPHGIVLREQALQEEFLRLQQDLYVYQKSLVENDEERGKRKAFSLSLSRPSDPKRIKTEDTVGNRILFCDDMDSKVAEADLIATFSSFAGFERVRFIEGKRVAFVDFKNVESASVALRATDSTEPFTVSFAKR